MKAAFFSAKELFMLKYAVNEFVVYGADGICEITEICRRKFGRQFIEYYTLKPVYDEKSAIYIPVDNEKLVAKMNRVMSKNELTELISSLPQKADIWVDDDRERQEKYKNVIGNGNREELFILIRTIYRKQRELIQKGKKLHAADERALKDAQKLLHEELAHVFGIDRADVTEFIKEKLNTAE